MLKHELLHPEILAALGAAGHGSKVPRLVADGNYPFSTGAHPNARHVYLNLAPALVRVTNVLRVLVGAIPIGAADVMVPESGKEPAVFHEFCATLLADVQLKRLGQFEFFNAVRDSL
jgi:L-fucose mutarotase